MPVGDTVALPAHCWRTPASTGVRLRRRSRQEETEAWVYTGSDELGLFNGSAHPEAAKEFVTYWGSEGNRLRLEADGLPLNMTPGRRGELGRRERRPAGDVRGHTVGAARPSSSPSGSGDGPGQRRSTG